MGHSGIADHIDRNIVKQSDYMRKAFRRFFHREVTVDRRIETKQRYAAVEAVERPAETAPASIGRPICAVNVTVVSARWVWMAEINRA